MLKFKIHLSHYEDYFDNIEFCIVDISRLVQSYFFPFQLVETSNILLTAIEYLQLHAIANFPCRPPQVNYYKTSVQLVFLFLLELEFFVIH